MNILFLLFICQQLFSAEQKNILLLANGHLLKKIFKPIGDSVDSSVANLLYIEHNKSKRIAPECALIHYVNASNYSAVDWLLETPLDNYGLIFIEKDCDRDCSNRDHFKVLNPCMIAISKNDTRMISVLTKHHLFEALRLHSGRLYVINTEFHKRTHTSNDLNYDLCSAACCGDIKGFTRELKKGSLDSTIARKNRNSELLVMWAAIKNQDLPFLKQLHSVQAYKYSMYNNSARLLQSALLNESLHFFELDSFFEQYEFDGEHAAFFEKLLQSKMLNCNQLDLSFQSTAFDEFDFTLLDYCLVHPRVDFLFYTMLQKNGAKRSEELLLIGM